MDVEISAIYERVAAKWSTHKADILEGRCGYSLFGSKPLMDPPLMIVGLNPGYGGAATGEPDLQTKPPAHHYLDDDRYRLKTMLEALFAFEGGGEILKRAVSTNFLFFRSVSWEGGDLSWMNVRRDVREELEAYCLDELREIIRLLRPRCMLVVGLKGVDAYVPDNCVRLYRAEAGFARLIVTGSFEGTPCVGIPHLTGSRLKPFDIDLMSLWLRQYFALRPIRS